MLQLGVKGITGKRDSPTSILAAVRAALAGDEWVTSELAAVLAQDATRPRLSAQEERLLVLYASGLTLDASAAAIGVRPSTP